jgi:hypothetical protein
MLPVDAITRITDDSVHVDQTCERVAGDPTIWFCSRSQVFVTKPAWFESVTHGNTLEEKGNDEPTRRSRH